MPLFGPNITKMEQRGDIKGLTKELGNKKSEIRVEVVKSLSRLKHIDGLIEALKNDIPEVCIEATKALSKLKHIEGLAEALKGNPRIPIRYSEEMSVRAVQILNEIGDPKVTEALIERFLSDQSKAVQEKAWEAIDKLVMEAGMWRTMAYKLTEQKRYAESLKCCERGIEIDPDDDCLWYLKGWNLWRCNKNEQAIAPLKKGLEINPKNREAKELIGRILRSSKDSGDWRELKRKKEAALQCWRQFQQSGLFSSLKEMYKVFKDEYLEWSEEENMVRVRHISRTSVSSCYDWYEFGLEGTEFGIVLYCELGRSEGYWDYLDRESGESGNLYNMALDRWAKMTSEFNFTTFVDDIRMISEDDLAECFEYILGRRKDKPRITP